MDEEQKYKVCNRCERLLRVPQDFHRRTISPDGFQHACKECLSAFRRRQRAIHKLDADPVPTDPLDQILKKHFDQVMKDLEALSRRKR